MTQGSKENNKAIANLNDNISDKLNDRGILASYLLSPSSKITNLEHTSQIEKVKTPDSYRVNDLLMKKQNQLPSMTICGHSLIQIKN